MAKEHHGKANGSRDAGKVLAGKSVLGTTRDGVRILKPNGNATHFTRKEISSAVASVMAAKRAG